MADIYASTWAWGQRVGVRVDGLGPMLRRLEGMGSEMRKALIDGGMRAGEPALQRARLEVPVKSGALRSTVRLARTARGVKIAAGSGKVRYAKAVHFGNKRLRIKTSAGGFATHPVPPTPFLFRAVDATADKIAAAYMAEILTLWESL